MSSLKNQPQVAMLTIDRACTSSLYTTTYGQVMQEFDCSREVATLGLSTFVLGLAFGPMLLGPVSEVLLTGGLSGD